MTILLPALAVTFGAFCVWLTVRVVNRRERWAKWTAVVVVAFPLLYVASFGPAWATIGPRRVIEGAEDDTLLRACRAIYRPVFWAMHESPLFSGAMDRYCELWQSSTGR